MSLRRKIIAVVAALVFLTIALSVFWGYRALTFPWLETAGRLPKGEFAFSKAPSQPESDIVAAASLRAGVIWIDEFVLHERFSDFGLHHRMFLRHRRDDRLAPAHEIQTLLGRERDFFRDDVEFRQGHRARGVREKALWVPFELEFNLLFVYTSQR